MKRLPRFSTDPTPPIKTVKKPTELKFETTDEQIAAHAARHAAYHAEADKIAATLPATGTQAEIDESLRQTWNQINDDYDNEI